MAGWITINYRSGNEVKRYVDSITILAAVVVTDRDFMIPLDLIQQVGIGSGVEIRETLKEEC